MAGTFKALEWTRELPLTASEKALMYALCSYLDERNSCFPSQARLGKDAGMTDRNVRRLFVRWERIGLIRREARMRDDGRGRSSDRIIVNVGATIDQPDILSALDQPDISGDQPDTQGTTNRTQVSRELPENSQRRTSPANVDSEPTICATCGCSTDRPGSRRVKRKDVVCLHEVAS